jgi:hypothetical protein
MSKRHSTTNPPHCQLTSIDESGLSAANTVKGKLQRIAYQWLKDKEAKDEIPTSLRFLFYELENAGHVSKNTVKLDGTPGKRPPAADMTAAVTVLRKLGKVPWDWIVDESRDVDTWRYADSVHDYLLDTIDRAAIDRFAGVERPVIITESRGIGGVLSRGVAGDYRVTVAATGGMSNGFLGTQVAKYLMDPLTKPLYIGDHDLAGNDIEGNTRRVLEHACGRTFDNWERLMLTDEQCAVLKRRGVKPIRKKDRRFKDGNPHQAYEAEALGQALVMQIVRDRLEELAPVPLAEILDREDEQREEVRRLLSGEAGPPRRSR